MNLVADLVRGLWYVALDNCMGSCPTVGIPLGILNVPNLYVENFFVFWRIMYYVPCTIESLVLGPNIARYEHVPIAIAYRHTCKFSRYNFSPQKMRQNDPILLQLSKFQYFRRNTGIYLLSCYNASVASSLYILCCRIHS